VVRFRRGKHPPLVATLAGLSRALHALDWQIDQIALLPLAPGQDEALDQDTNLAVRALLTRLDHRSREQGEDADYGTEDGEGRVRDLAGDLLLQVLQFHGPLSIPELARRYGLKEHAGLLAALDGLVSQGFLVRGHFSQGGGDLEVCESENLQRLLRLLRYAGRKPIAPKPLREAVCFVAGLHLISTPGETLADLERQLERLIGFEAPVACWEGELLAARMAACQSAWLDSLMQNSGLVWCGTGEGRIAFMFQQCLDLLDGVQSSPSGRERSAAPSWLRSMTDTRARLPFLELQAQSGQTLAEFTRQLWTAAWQGQISCDSFEVLRQGLATGFAPPLFPADSRLRPRRRGGWSRSTPGTWFALQRGTEPSDLLQEQERSRERVFLLFDRYGVLYRERLVHELPPFRWSAVLPTLLLM
jgi:ATP-dependent Lhr-like helicase